VEMVEIMEMVEEMMEIVEEMLLAQHLSFQITLRFLIIKRKITAHRLRLDPSFFFQCSFRRICSGTNFALYARW